MRTRPGDQAGRWARAFGNGAGDFSTAAVRLEVLRVRLDGAGWRRAAASCSIAATPAGALCAVYLNCDGVDLNQTLLVEAGAVAWTPATPEWAHQVGPGSHTWTLVALGGAGQTAYVANTAGRVPHLFVQELGTPG
jgi:hypothetical protein